MTARWALALPGSQEQPPLRTLMESVIQQLGPRATAAREEPRLADLRRKAAGRMDEVTLQKAVTELSHEGFLYGAVVALADACLHRPRAVVAVVLARELLDAVDPALGTQILRAVVADLAHLSADETEHRSLLVTCNLSLGDALLAGGDPQAALPHFEAVLSVDIDHPGALRGFAAAASALEQRGIRLDHRSRGLSALEGLEDAELGTAAFSDRYEIGRPLGRGRHAVVYQAHDRRVGREVALKRLLPRPAGTSGSARRIVEARFFAEAEALGRVRSPFVVALFDVQREHRFIALELCRGGNLLRALRRRRIGPDDLPRVSDHLRQAVSAVHAAGAVHRDIKPANLLLRGAAGDTDVVLADFGLAIHDREITAAAGTLRYLAPELRQAGASATRASDLFAAGVVLLEIALAPRPLPAAFDRLDHTFDARSVVPEDLPEPFCHTLRTLLAPRPEDRSW